ncbi:hypothetical protein [Bdellovibrio sp.]|uniref:hypothetical protein n=1 Tax=Bdellovibrio sp. TaxID=28201 RepID=UPI0039E54BA1
MKWRWIAIFGFLMGLTACSMEAHIFDGNSVVTDEHRVSPDFVAGEAVQSYSGHYEVRAAFGEISENRSASGTYEVQAVFYK